jgi:hypothetical protein
MSGPKGWTTREALPIPREAAGLLLVSPEADVVVPLTAEDRTTALEIAATTLRAAGVGPSDRVVVALNNDGEATGTLMAQACAGIARAAAAPGPRGRLRLHRALETVRATTLITTPTGAMDLLARLHLEFLLDPLDLGLRRILLAGEIPSPGTYAQLASEFGAEVGELYVDPYFGLPLARRSAAEAAYTFARDGSAAVAPLGKDILLEPPYAAGPAEIVLTPAWHSTLAGSTLRTGHVVGLGDDAGVPGPEHTVGEHILVRGRWISIPRVAAALSRVDGIAHWDLRVAREGTLDAATLHVTFNRPTLVHNPMWRSRIHQALIAITPVTVEIAVEDEVAEQIRPGSVTDLRGHHLGRDRSAVQ